MQPARRSPSDCESRCRVLTRGRPRRTGRRRLRTLLQGRCAAAGSERDDPAPPVRLSPQGPATSRADARSQNSDRSIQAGRNMLGALKIRLLEAARLARGTGGARGRESSARGTSVARFAREIARRLATRNKSAPRGVSRRAVNQCRAQSAPPPVVPFVKSRSHSCETWTEFPSSASERLPAKVAKG